MDNSQLGHWLRSRSKLELERRRRRRAKKRFPWRDDYLVYVSRCRAALSLSHGCCYCCQGAVQLPCHEEALRLESRRARSLEATPCHRPDPAGYCRNHRPTRLLIGRFPACPALAALRLVSLGGSTMRGCCAVPRQAWTFSFDALAEKA